MMNLVTVITPTYNSENSIEACIKSVHDQRGVTVEHLVVDGSSTDKTKEILKKHENVTHISEPDNGIYDALNKGLRLASGDFIAICHSDDVFIDPDALFKLVNGMQQSDSDFSYADCIYLSGKRLVRYYKSGELNKRRLSYGLAPAHTTLVMRRSLISTVGYYSLKYPICGDFEYFTRLLGHSYTYVKEPLVVMSPGGASGFTYKNAWRLSRELYEVLSKYGVATNLYKIFTRYPLKTLSSQLNKLTYWSKKCR